MCEKNEWGRGDVDWEIKLLQKAKAGDQSAINDLLESHRPLIQSLAGKYRFSLEYEDACQEATIIFLGLIQDCDPTRARLITLATKVIPRNLSVIAKKARIISHPQSPRADEESPGMKVVCPLYGKGGLGPEPEDSGLGDCSVENSASLSELAETVEKALRRLSPETQAVIRAIYLGDDGGRPETAEGPVNPGSVWYYKERGLRELKEYLQNKVDTDEL